MELPISWYERVVVTFPLADVDVLVVHTLPRTIDAESIEYQVVRVNQAAIVYDDHSATRRAWGPGYLFLRSNVSATVADILLTLPTLDKANRRLP